MKTRVFRRLHRTCTPGVIRSISWCMTNTPAFTTRIVAESSGVLLLSQYDATTDEIAGSTLHLLSLLPGEAILTRVTIQNPQVPDMRLDLKVYMELVSGEPLPVLHEAELRAFAENSRAPEHAGRLLRYAGPRAVTFQLYTASGARQVSAAFEYQVNPARWVSRTDHHGQH